MNQEQTYGVEPEVTDDVMQDPVLAQYQTEGEQQKWIDELEASRKERKTFDEKGRKTIKRYADERESGEEGRSFYNVFFANTEIKMAALYARTPMPDIKRRFDDADDDVSRVAATMLQRNIAYELECEGFDAKFRQMLFDRLVPGIGIGWARMEQDIDPMTGQPMNEQADIDYVAWDDFLWAPCRVWTECRWVGRRIPMSKEAVKARFGSTAPALILQNLSFAKPSATNVESKDALKPKNQVEATVDVFELWDKERRLVFWVTESAEVPLDVKADTNEFPEFFPTPLPPLGRFTTSNTIPRSDYSLVQDQYRELDDLNNRCANLTKALQLRWVYDATNPALKDLYQTGAELQGIPVKDWAAMMSDKGGLKGSIDFAPLNEIAATYKELIGAREAVKDQINEIEGIADAMRGMTDRYVSATATNQAGSVGASRIAIMRRDVADYIARLLRLKSHLICKFYSPQTIISRAGQMSGADAPLLGPAIELLRNKTMSHFRLSVSVDSIQLEDWTQDRNEKTAAVTALVQLLGQIFQAAERFPGSEQFGAHIAKFLITGFRGSDQLEGYLDQFLQQAQQQQAQKAAQPPQPNAAELKAQAAQQRLQVDLQIAQMQEETKRQMVAMQGQIDAYRLQIDQLVAATKAKKVEADIARDQAHTHIDVVTAAHDAAMDRVGQGGL